MNAIHKLFYILLFIIFVLPISGESFCQIFTKITDQTNPVVTDPWSGQYVGASYSKTSYKSTLAGITCR